MGVIWDYCVVFEIGCVRIVQCNVLNLLIKGRCLKTFNLFCVHIYVCALVKCVDSVAKTMLTVHDKPYIVDKP